MIELPMSNEEELELVPRIVLYNRLTLLIDQILIVLFLVRGLSVVQNFGFAFISIVLLFFFGLLVLDMFMALVIEFGPSRQIRSITQFYLLPVLLDILLIIFAGLGIVKIFFRIVTYGALNPENLYYDESDPLFTDE